MECADLIAGRFARSRNVGAYFGLTPRRYASGEVDRSGRITKRGDGTVRTLLYEAANVLLLKISRTSSLREWGLAIAQRSGFKKALFPLAVDGQLQPFAIVALDWLSVEHMMPCQVVR